MEMERCELASTNRTNPFYYPIHKSLVISRLTISLRVLTSGSVSDCAGLCDGDASFLQHVGHHQSTALGLGDVYEFRTRREHCLDTELQQKFTFLIIVRDIPVMYVGSFIVVHVCTVWGSN
jgi:hypothetical protein